MDSRIKNTRKTADEIQNAEEFVSIIRKILQHELDFTFDQASKITNNIIDEYNEQ